MPSVAVKTLGYLGNKERLIVAGKYLENGNIVFVDRKNSSLLVTDTEDESFQELNLCALLPKEYRAHTDPKKKPTPSDVNKGFEDDQLLITFTVDKYSVAIACKLGKESGKDVLSPPLQIVRVNERARSIVALDRTTVCADTEYYIIVKNKNDNDDVDVRKHPRNKRDRGGLLMTDGQGNFYYGDGDSFVGCHWDCKNIEERFRVLDKRMKFPRDSAISAISGRIFICTDSSRAIFSISVHGNDLNREIMDKGCQYGDIDFNPEGRKYFTTFWKENEWPILHEIRS